MMKRCGICIVALLVLPTAVFGSIIADIDDWYEDSGGTGYAYGNSRGTSAWSQVNGYMPSGWAGGQGDYRLITTESADCHWSAYVYVYAAVEAQAVEGYVGALAYASAWAGCQWGAARVPDADVKITEPGEATAGNVSDSNGGTHRFRAYFDGCGATHQGVVAAVVTPGSNSTASAHACVTATVSMVLAQD